jgi:carbon storage regulator
MAFANGFLSGRIVMLVLTRRIGEEIIIDGDIRITVVAISGERTRLGISAPPSVRVDRREIYERRSRLRQGGSTPVGRALCPAED